MREEKQAGDNKQETGRVRNETKERGGVNQRKVEGRSRRKWARGRQRRSREKIRLKDKKNGVFCEDVMDATAAQPGIDLGGMAVCQQANQREEIGGGAVKIDCHGNNR